jgi:hypothetical protein
MMKKLPLITMPSQSLILSPLTSSQQGNLPEDDLHRENTCEIDKKPIL